MSLLKDEIGSLKSLEEKIQMMIMKFHRSDHCKKRQLQESHDYEANQLSIVLQLEKYVQKPFKGKKAKERKENDPFQHIFDVRKLPPQSELRAGDKGKENVENDDVEKENGKKMVDKGKEKETKKRDKEIKKIAKSIIRNGNSKLDKAVAEGIITEEGDVAHGVIFLNEDGTVSNMTVVLDAIILDVQEYCENKVHKLLLLILAVYLSLIHI